MQEKKTGHVTLSVFQYSDYVVPYVDLFQISFKGMQQVEF